MGLEAVKLRNKVFLAVFIIFNMALLSLGDISATEENIDTADSNLTSQITYNITNTPSSTNVTNLTDINSSKINSINDTANIENITYAAGNNASNNYTNIHGIWISSGDVNNLDVESLINANITDIFVKINNTNYQSIIDAILIKVKGTGIRVNAWITCFKDSSGSWVDPQGIYSYQIAVPYTAAVKVAYKKSWYKSWYKYWYKYRGKWRYKWKYTWRYKWLYKTSYVTKYYYSTQYFSSTTYRDNLTNFISDIATNYNINGIHLDYVRYSGVAQYGNAAYQQPGGLNAAVNSITSFVANVHSTIYSTNNLNVSNKPYISLSAALMPEGSLNDYYYGQNYTQLANYLDFMVPMIYKGNYGYDSSTGTSSSGKNGTDWIGSTVAYIVSQTNGTPVVAGLQAYRSDDNTTPLSAEELQNDIDAAINNGSSGYVLFKYGLISSDFININTTDSNGTVESEGTQLPPSTSIPSELQQYIQATANCQVNDTSIKALAASLIVGKTSVYDRAAAIFNWVRDNLGYSFYYNTKYGAAGTLSMKTGNCVDTAHLVVALERAAGIPARYEHLYAQFTSGSWYGHVIAQIYVNGQWYRADGTSYSNAFGVIKSWNTATATYYGTYASLPF